MSQWIRNYKPSEIDADEWGNILVLRENGQKAVYHWEDYNEHYATEETAWMTLPESDIPQSVSVTIEVGDRAYTVENNGFTIEVHDSRDPMGQPTVFQTKDTITGILEAVGAILQEELGESLSYNDLVELMDMQERADEYKAPPQKPWNKKK